MKKKIMISAIAFLLSALLIYVIVYHEFFEHELANSHRTSEYVIARLRLFNVFALSWLPVVAAVCIIFKDDLLYSIINVVLGALWIKTVFNNYPFHVGYFSFAKTIYMILGFMLMTYGLIVLIIGRKIGMIVRALAFVIFPILTRLYPTTFTLHTKSAIIIMIMIALILWIGTILWQRKKLNNIYLSIPYMALCVMCLVSCYMCLFGQRADVEWEDVFLEKILPKGLMGILALEMMASLLLIEEGKKLHRVICLLPAIYAGIDSLKASGIKDESIARMIPNLRAAGIWLFIAITVVHIGLWIFEMIKKKKANFNAQ